MPWLRVQLGVPADRRSLELATALLTRQNVALMRRRRLPALYLTNVRYRREPRGQESWRRADEVLAEGYGDCEDLSAYRAAELQVQGEPARVIVTRTARRTWHAQVQRADGSVEDPSRFLKWKAKQRPTRR